MQTTATTKRYVFGIEYKETSKSRVFKKTSLTKVGPDTKAMHDAITKSAEALKKQENWFEVKTTKKPL